MQDVNTYIDAGWDFVGETENGPNDIWKIVEGQTYPLLSWQKYGGRTGEPNDPYLIATAEQLLDAEFWQPGVYYKLCCDIDLAGRTVYARDDFDGHLDGDGYAIRHARILPSGYLQGFFGQVRREASISNLTLADFSITVAEPDDTLQVGGAAGLAVANSGTITNCHATGWIIAHGGNV